MIRKAITGVVSFFLLAGMFLAAHSQEKEKATDASSLLKTSLKKLKNQKGFSISHSTSIRVRRLGVTIQGKGDLDKSQNTFAMKITNSPFGVKGQVYARNNDVVYRGGLKPDKKGWVKKPINNSSMVLYKPATILGIVKNKELTGNASEKESGYVLNFPVPAPEVQKYIDPVSGTHIIQSILKKGLGKKASDNVKISVKSASATVRVRKSDSLPQQITMNLNLNVHREGKGEKKGKTFASPRLKINLNLHNFNHKKSVTLPPQVKAILK